MSQSIDVYCKNLSAELVPKIVKRLNEFDMVVEIHPDFKLDQERDSGFVPFKFKWKNPYFKKLEEKDLKTGFEIYFYDFDLQKAKNDLQPKRSFFDKLIGKKQPEMEYAKPDIEKRLIQCNKVVSFVWHAADIFEFRFAFMTSAVLAELTNGVCYYPPDDIWYDTKYIVDQAYRESSAFERSIKEDELRFHEFDGW